MSNPGAKTAADAVLSWLSRFGFGAAALGFTANFCLFTVDGGEKSVVWRVFGGMSNKVYNEGSHLMIPWFMRPCIYNVKLQPREIKTTTGTKDLQMATIHVRLLFRPDANKLVQLHTSLGPEYGDRVIPSIGNEVLKAIVAEYNAEELLTQRDKVSREIRSALVERCGIFDIELCDVAITHLSYGREFAKAIEEKQVAQQDAERQKFIVARSEQERIANVIRAEGEAEAANMISEALKTHGTGLIDVRKIDAAKEIAATLARHPGVMYLPQNLNALLNINPSTGGR